MGVPNCSRTLLQPRVMMKDCFPTRLHSVSRDTEHLNTQTSSSGKIKNQGFGGGKNGIWGGEMREEGVERENATGTEGKWGGMKGEREGTERKRR